MSNLPLVVLLGPNLDMVVHQETTMDSMVIHRDMYTMTEERLFRACESITSAGDDVFGIAFYSECCDIFFCLSIDYPS